MTGAMEPSLKRYLKSLQAAGVRRIPGGTEPTAPSARRSATRAEREQPRPPVALAVAVTAPTAAPDCADPAAVLADVARRVADCTRCALAATRTLTVPGEGDPRARIVFVGEGPGADEDKSGRPFVGRAGQLLEDIIVKGMRSRRDAVFIANVVKCRPPGNRVPAPDEVAACAGFLDEQLAALRPAVICALGSTAASRLLGQSRPLGQLRGITHDWRGIPVIVTYHPAYLLRNPAAKRPTWSDIQRVMDLAGVSPS